RGKPGLELSRRQTEEFPWSSARHVESIGQRNLRKPHDRSDAAVGESPRTSQVAGSRNDNLALGQYLQLLVPFAIAPWRQTRKAAGIASQDDAGRRLDAQDTAHDGGRQVMAVADDARPELVGGKLLPDIIIVPRQHGVRAVAQVRAQASAGGDGVTDASSVGCRVPQRDDNACLHSTLDKP